MVGRKEAPRTLPVFLALSVACTNGMSDRAVLVLSSAATQGTRDFAALPGRVALTEERLDIANPHRKALLQDKVTVRVRNVLSVRGGVLRAGAKDNNKGIRLPSSPIDRALAVNGVSWAAVVGGAVLWSRTKMVPKEGVRHKKMIPQPMVATRGLGVNIMHTTAVVSLQSVFLRHWFSFYTAGGKIFVVASNAVSDPQRARWAGCGFRYALFGYVDLLLGSTL